MSIILQIDKILIYVMYLCVSAVIRPPSVPSKDDSCADLRFGLPQCCTIQLKQSLP